MSNKVKIDKRDNVYILTINRPEALNALNEEVLTDLNEAIDIVIGDENGACSHYHRRRQSVCRRRRYRRAGCA